VSAESSYAPHDAALRWNASASSLALCSLAFDDLEASGFALPSGRELLRIIDGCRSNSSQSSRTSRTSSSFSSCPSPPDVEPPSTLWSVLLVDEPRRHCNSVPLERSECDERGEAPFSVPALDGECGGSARRDALWPCSGNLERACCEAAFATCASERLRDPDSSSCERCCAQLSSAPTSACCRGDEPLLPVRTLSVAVVLQHLLLSPSSLLRMSASDSEGVRRG